MKIRQQRTSRINICKKMILLSFCMILMVSMSGAVKLGLISGMTETTIAPQENATRAQAAMMFKRLYDRIRF